MLARGEKVTRGDTGIVTGVTASVDPLPMEEPVLTETGDVDTAPTENPAACATPDCAEGDASSFLRTTLAATLGTEGAAAMRFIGGEVSGWTEGLRIAGGTKPGMVAIGGAL